MRKSEESDVILLKTKNKNIPYGTSGNEESDDSPYSFTEDEIENTQFDINKIFTKFNFSAHSSGVRQSTKFLAKDFIALLAGLMVASGLRWFIDADKDVSIIPTRHGTEMTLTDMFGCFVMLISASVLFKCFPKKIICDGVSLARASVRYLIPFFFGMGIMVLFKFIDAKAGDADIAWRSGNHRRIIELSDVLGGMALLFMFNLTHFLLESVWHKDFNEPYPLSQSFIAPSVAKPGHTEFVVPYQTNHNV